ADRPRHRREGPRVRPRGPGGARRHRRRRGARPRPPLRGAHPGGDLAHRPPPAGPPGPARRLSASSPAGALATGRTSSPAAVAPYGGAAPGRTPRPRRGKVGIGRRMAWVARAHADGLLLSSVRRSVGADGPRARGRAARWATDIGAAAGERPATGGTEWCGRAPVAGGLGNGKGRSPVGTAPGRPL